MNIKQEICGAIHIHTNYSDGGVTYEELIKTASILKLDYIVVTDHMSLGGKHDGYEGYHNGVHVLVGYEHHDPNKLNHYLAMGVNSVIGQDKSAAEYVCDIHHAGGVGFLAHPAEKRDYFIKLPPYPWTEWSTDLFDGIEIWNQMSDWVEQLRSWFSFIRVAYPRRFMGSPPLEALQKWDQLNRTRMVSGIGGVDAHSFRFGIGFLTLNVFPIKVMLKGIRTHLFFSKELRPTEFDASKKLIINALRDGNGFISNFRQGDARGSRFFIKNKNGTIGFPGKTVPASIPAVLYASIPEKADIHLIENGIRKETISSSSAEYEITKPGVYRIEVTKKSKAWIYTNPFPVGMYPI
jgi:hypothetical protein